MNPEEIIAHRLHRVRKERGLSLEQAARLCAVSKPMLSQIERGQSVPTITSLWKIATGFRLPLSWFLEEEKPAFQVVDFDTVPLADEGEKMQARVLFPYNPQERSELFLIDFAPGCHHVSKAHAPGVVEYILVQKGQLEMQVGEEVMVLTEQKALRFQADVFHAYANRSDRPCRVFNIIYYPEK